MKSKKLLLLITALSLCVLTVLSVVAVKAVKKRNNNKTTATTSETASNQTTLTTAAKTTAKATEKTKSEANSVTEKKTQPAPKIDPSSVKVGFFDSIYHYTSLEQGVHKAIGLDFNKDYYNELINIACEKTGLPSEAILSIYKFKTVKSTAEIEKIYRKYLSDDIVNEMFPRSNSILFNYNNELYWIEGAVGTFDYDVSSITYKGEKDGGYVVAIDQFLGNGSYLTTESFLVKYIDGNFKIVKKLGEEKLHPTDYYSPNYSSLLVQCYIE